MERYVIRVPFRIHTGKPWFNCISVDTGNFKLTYREDEEMKRYVIRDFLLESTQVNHGLIV